MSEAEEKTVTATTFNIEPSEGAIEFCTCETTGLAAPLAEGAELFVKIPIELVRARLSELGE